ncbi:MAG: acyl-CoA dehydrogenase family protein [Rhodococcus sp. (in: high G+C Gram-positive bacteria)]|uniref:acyl-CoA dehydrogenase family protein n=1 Tax=Rhodococcus sp. TaxID=1831 RepID=UPI002AD70521|nr:acyl-CoA dehydrogenase family protein [Rhodococcus sp. (in: high G+C Gram-positive bacteria)]
MDFAYTPRLNDLKARARTLTDTIMAFELECEHNNGLSEQSHATIKAAVLDAGLQAINTPAEYGGAGLSILEQAVVRGQSG